MKKSGVDALRGSVTMPGMATEQANTGGGFLSLLTLIFITLKLTGHIDWSWWWVLSPVWIPLAIVVAMALVVVVIAACGRPRR